MTHDKKGPALNERVWRLFERAGFQTEPNSNSPAEHVVVVAKKQRPLDLYATDPELKVTIVGSNKAGSIKGWSKELHDLRAIADKAKADAAVFVATGKKLEDEDMEQAKELGIQTWDEQQLEYFDAVTEAIGDYAKFEIINTLGITTSEEKDIHKVLAVQIEQPIAGSPVELFMFSTSPERLLRTCTVYRRAAGHADAYQRMLRKDRLPAIRKFVSQPGALLPTNVVLALNENVTIETLKQKKFSDVQGKPITLSKTDFRLVALGIPMEYASLELLDGQHRLFGFAKTDTATKKSFNLVVLGIRGLIQQTKQETFVAINDNSRRMDPNLVSYLKYTKDDAQCQKDPELMAIRVVVDLNDQEPFYRKIRLLDVGKQKITLKGFSGYDLRGLLGKKGALRKQYPNNKPSEYVGALRLYFSTIRSMFKKEWDEPQTYIISANRGISAFLKLLKSLLLTTENPLTQEQIKKYYKPLTALDWDYANLSKSYVGSQGWKDFERATEDVGLLACASLAGALPSSFPTSETGTPRIAIISRAISMPLSLRLNPFVAAPERRFRYLG
jgi:DGQHR domain-containing protein